MYVEDKKNEDVKNIIQCRERTKMFLFLFHFHHTNLLLLLTSIPDDLDDFLFSIFETPTQRHGTLGNGTLGYLK